MKKCRSVLPPAFEYSPMLASSDTELLDDFTRTRSEAAFCALVERHVGHVHSVAWRGTRSPELAADAAQHVFSRLAQLASTLPPGVSLSAWLHTAVTTMTKTHLATVAVIAAVLKDLREGTSEWDPEAKMVKHMLLTRWARESPDSAYASLAALDPKRAVTWLQNPGNKLIDFPFVGQILAATWVASRPEGDGKNQAMGDVMWNWTKQNPVQASTWLHDQPPGPSRDAGINGLALATFDNDPEGALTWAASISDEKTRAGSLAIGLGAWSKKDAAAAEAWAARQGLTLPEPTRK